MDAQLAPPNAFKQIRLRLEMSQGGMAEALGCSQGNISFYEKGQTVPPEVARRLIAVAAEKGHTVTFDDIYADPSANVEAEDAGQPG